MTTTATSGQGQQLAASLELAAAVAEEVPEMCRRDDGSPAAAAADASRVVEQRQAQQQNKFSEQAANNREKEANGEEACRALKRSAPCQVEADEEEQWTIRSIEPKVSFELEIACQCVRLSSSKNPISLGAGG